MPLRVQRADLGPGAEVGHPHAVPAARVDGCPEESHALVGAIEHFHRRAVHPDDGARLRIALRPGADAAAVGHEDEAGRALEQASGGRLLPDPQQLRVQGRTVVDHAGDFAGTVIAGQGIGARNGHFAQAVLVQGAHPGIGRASHVTDELPGRAPAANPEMASRAGRADGDAPAVDEAGLREARAVARMAGEQGSLDIAVGGNIATRAAGGQRRGGQGGQNKASAVKHGGFPGGMAKLWMGWLSMRNQGEPYVLAAACGPGGPQEYEGDARKQGRAASMWTSLILWCPAAR